MKYVERKRTCTFSAKYRHSLKLPTFLKTTTLQRCKLIYAFEGGLRGFGGIAACTILISSRTMSVQSERFHTLSPKERRLLYSFPSTKTSGAETFAPRRTPYITSVPNPIQGCIKPAARTHKSYHSADQFFHSRQCMCDLNQESRS